MTYVHAPPPSGIWVLSSRLAVSVTAAVASMVGAHALGALLDAGPFSLHMMEHMALLGLAAPITAYALHYDYVGGHGRRLTAAVALQIGLLWMWHLPPVFSAVCESDVLHILMSGSLYAAGVWFWSAVYGTSGPNRWQSVMALLLTGKLFCLFAAILVFSPRPLYAGGAHTHHGHSDALVDILDQQLAGLIMITVCPLTYVAAGLVVVARWIGAMEREDNGGLHAAASRHSSLRSWTPLLIAPLSTILAGCEGVQSALSPASPEAQSVYSLTVVLFVGGTAIFFLVLLALSVALFASERSRARIGDTRIVVLGGIVFPVTVLTLLLGFGLWLAQARPALSHVQEIALQGERWWWRLTYADEQATAIASANEIRVEVGRPVRIKMTSNNIIHSFWVPALAGKVDLIPGRTNEILFTPTRPGIYRGQCAEYCGGAHALMGLRVVVMETDAFTRWRESVRRPSRPPADPLITRGQQVFLASCVGCHEVRGTGVGGRLGPDLTHVGSRAAIAAETLSMSKDNLARWIRENQRLKPGSLMPEYTSYAPEDLDALVAYLASLK